MVTTEAGMSPIDLPESVGEPSRRQLTGREPAAEIGKSSRDRRKGDADQAESCERASLAEARPRGSYTCFQVDRHGTLQSKKIAVTSPMGFGATNARCPTGVVGRRRTRRVPRPSRISASLPG